METFLNGRVTLHSGNCLDVLATLTENSLDACCTDPPYHLVSIVKRFSSPTAKPVRVGDITATNDLKAAHARAAAGFMGKAWDGGDVAFRSETWAAVYRVLKPGAHLVAFGGTRTYHRLACAIEDAGFEIRDCVLWLYSSGFPKSHDVSKGIDKAAGAERVSLGRTNGAGSSNTESLGVFQPQYDITAPATDAARQWEGWGTALKPAAEFICLARKPLSEGTVAANVLKWGTGAINIDATRVPMADEDNQGSWGNGRSVGSCWSPGRENGGNEPEGKRSPLGRWPANVIHDGSEEVVAAFPETVSGLYKAGSTPKGERLIYGPDAAAGYVTQSDTYGDSGSAARFFYTAKADSDDRLGSKHPTVKPVDLMQYLVRLITPKGGTCLDPFAGTGTTGEAAWREGMNAVLIEREEEYQADIRRRMALCLAGPGERTRESIKARGKTDSPGPLFDALNP